MRGELGPVVNWHVPDAPVAQRLAGRTVRLEPVDPDRQMAGLWEAASADPHTWDYLPHGPFTSEDQFRAWLQWAADSSEHLFLTLIDAATGAPCGMASYMRVVPAHGTLEIGYIWFGPRLQRTTPATEAIFLLLHHAFDDLGYRRVEWKCNALNAASCRAAKRLGFTAEGIFRQHMVVKGRNRDTAWFAMCDTEWPRVRAAFQTWLSPNNFSAAGRQHRSLSVIRDTMREGEDPSPPAGDPGGVVG